MILFSSRSTSSRSSCPLCLLDRLSLLPAATQVPTAPAAMPSSFWPPQSGPSPLPFLSQGLNPSLFPLSSQLVTMPYPGAAAATAVVAAGGVRAGGGASGQEAGQPFAAPFLLGLPFGQMPQFPIRPGQPNCNFYMRTGSCAFGPTCKFNHPLPQVKEVGGRFLTATGPALPSLLLISHASKNMGSFTTTCRRLTLLLEIAFGAKKTSSGLPHCVVRDHCDLLIIADAPVV